MQCEKNELVPLSQPLNINVFLEAALKFDSISHDSMEDVYFLGYKKKKKNQIDTFVTSPWLILCSGCSKI